MSIQGIAGGLAAYLSPESESEASEATSFDPRDARNAAVAQTVGRLEGDLVTLSALARSGDGLGALLQNSGGAQTSVLDDLEARTETLREQFVKSLTAKLNEAGVDLETPFNLALEGDAVIVANDHPDKEKIEAVLAENPVLGDAFKDIKVQSEVARNVRANKNVMAMRNAMATYTNLFQDDADDLFSLSVKAFSSAVYFGRR